MNELIIKISNIFKKYGVKSVTMEDIANELGISKKKRYISILKIKMILFLKYHNMSLEMNVTNLTNSVAYIQMLLTSY